MVQKAGENYPERRLPEGLIPVAVTPFSENGSVDREGFRKNLVSFRQAGAVGVVVAGSIGEQPHLAAAEVRLLARLAREALGGGFLVIAGVGLEGSHVTADLAANCADAGASMVMVRPPGYYASDYTVGALEQHFRFIADQTPVPIVLYNSPEFVRTSLPIELVATLMEHPNIVGIKDATGDMNRGKELIDLCGDDINIYSGDDPTTLDLIRLGGKGGISVTANIAPKEMHQLCTLALKGEYVQAAAINDKLMPLHNNLFVESNPIPVKWALAEMGRIPHGIRLPLTWLDSASEAPLRDAMQGCGLL